MKLIILYGPPAVGKLTIASELAGTTDVKVFDNHQVIDMFSSLVSREYSEFSPTVYEIIRTILEAVIKADQSNVVITFAYAANIPRDVEFLNQIISFARKHGSEVYPVFLQCDNSTLLQRATESSRKAYGKITTREAMQAAIHKYDFNTPLDIEGNVTFNTAEKSAKEVAAEIMKLAVI